MSKITNDGLAQSSTGCFIACCTSMATVGIKGLMHQHQPVGWGKLASDDVVWT